MIKQCKKCGSENLYLEPRVKGQDIMTANMVALKCKDCGNWLKWCPKDERQFYINKNQENKVEECWVIQRGNDLYAMYIPSNDTFVFNTFIQLSLFHSSKDEAVDSIQTYHLQDCRPVKVEIRVVGE